MNNVVPKLQIGKVVVVYNVAYNSNVLLRVNNNQKNRKPVLDDSETMGKQISRYRA